jgi:hypothetical protein
LSTVRFLLDQPVDAALNMGDQYVERRAQGSSAPLRIGPLLAKPGTFLIEGDVGLGKTTLLKQFYREIQSAHDRKHAYAHPLQDSERSFLRRHVPAVVALQQISADRNLWRLIADACGIELVVSSTSATRDPAAYYESEAFGRYVADALTRLGCVLLLDGLDEVHSDFRDRTAREIHRLLADLGPGARAIISARPRTEVPLPATVVRLRLAEFEDPELSLFKDRWLRGRQSAFTKALKGKPYESAARRPLMAAWLAMIFRADDDLPPRHVEVYSRIARILVRDWDKAKEQEHAALSRDTSLSHGSTALHIERPLPDGWEETDCVRVMSAIAFALAPRRRASFTETDFAAALSAIAIPDHAQRLRPLVRGTDPAALLRFYVNGTGLLVRARHEYAFVHASLYEYFVALWAVELFKAFAQRPMYEPRLSHALTALPAAAAVYVALEAGRGDALLQVAQRVAADGRRDDFYEPFLQRLVLEVERLDYSSPAGARRTAAAALWLVSKTPEQMRAPSMFDDYESVEDFVGHFSSLRQPIRALLAEPGVGHKPGVNGWHVVVLPPDVREAVAGRQATVEGRPYHAFAIPPVIADWIGRDALTSRLRH